MKLHYLDLSKLDLQGLQKARRDLIAGAKGVASPEDIKELLALIDRLIRRAEGASTAEASAQTPVRRPSR